MIPGAFPLKQVYTAGAILFRGLAGLAIVVAIAATLWALVVASHAWTAPFRIPDRVGAGHPAEYTILKALCLRSDAGRTAAGPVILGRDALGQRPGASSADAAHIALLQPQPDTWQIANISSRRRLQVTSPGKDPVYARRIPLEVGAVILAGEALLTVTDLPDGKDGRLRLMVETRDAPEPVGWTLAVKDLRPSGLVSETGVLSACKAPKGLLAGFNSGIREFGKNIANVNLKKREQPLLAIGGQTYCEGHSERMATLPLPGLQANGLQLVTRYGEISLAPSRSSAAAVQLPGQSAVTFGTRFVPLADEKAGGRFIAGRTSYAADVTSDPDCALRITPIRHAHRFFPPTGETAKSASEIIPPPGCFQPQGTLDSECSVSGEAHYTAHWRRLGEENPVNASPGIWLKYAVYGSGGVLFITGAGFLALHLIFIYRGKVLGRALARPGLLTLRLGAACVATSAVALLIHEGIPGHLSAIDETFALALAWAAGGLSFITGRRFLLRGFVFLLVTVVAALGAATQLHMSVFAELTRYEVSWRNHCAALASIAAAVTLFRLIPTRILADFLRKVADGPKLKAFVAGLLFLVLAVINVLWISAGDEGGVFGWQPSESNKPALVFLLAIAGCIFIGAWLNRHQLHSQRVSRSSLLFWVPAIILGVGFLAVPVLNTDFSPTLILMFSLLFFLLLGTAIFAVILLRWFILRPPRGRFPKVDGRLRLRRNGVGTSWKFLHHNAVPASTLAALSVVIVALFGLGLAQALADERQTVRGYLDLKVGSQLFTVYERILSYHDLKLAEDNAQAPAKGPAYPNLGFQVMQSRAVLKHAACGPRALQEGAAAETAALNSAAASLRAALCRAYLGPVHVHSPNQPDTELPNAFDIPAVHDDFAGAYLIHALGVDMGLALAACQTLLILALTAIGLALIFQPAAGKPDRGLRWFAGFCCLGFAGLIFSQSLLSWGNVYGMLPVMGQPMTFISAGGSHTLAVGISLLFVADFGLRFLETRPVKLAHTSAFGAIRTTGSS